MAQAVMKIDEETHQILRQLSTELGEPMGTIVGKAIEEYRRSRMFREADAAFAVLRRDPKAWKAEVDECERWSVTLPDRLDSDDVPKAKADMPRSKAHKKAAHKKQTSRHAR